MSGYGVRIPKGTLQRQRCFLRKRPGTFIIYVMDNEIDETLIQYLRENYQLRNDLGDNPLTTTDISMQLRSAGFYKLEIFEVNQYLKRVGFIGIDIPNDSDKFWRIQLGKI